MHQAVLSLHCPPTTAPPFLDWLFLFACTKAQPELRLGGKKAKAEGGRLAFTEEGSTQHFFQPCFSGHFYHTALLFVPPAWKIQFSLQQERKGSHTDSHYICPFSSYTHTHLHPSTSTDRWEQAAVTLWQQGCAPRCTPRASILLRALPANSTPLASHKRWKTAEAAQQRWAAQQPGSSSVHSCCLSLCLAPCAAGSPCLSPRPRSYCCRHTTNGFPNCILWLCVGFF